MRGGGTKPSCVHEGIGIQDIKHALRGRFPRKKTGVYVIDAHRRLTDIIISLILCIPHLTSLVSLYI